MRWFPLVAFLIWFAASASLALGHVIDDYPDVRLSHVAEVGPPHDPAMTKNWALPHKEIDLTALPAESGRTVVNEMGDNFVPPAWGLFCLTLAFAIYFFMATSGFGLLAP